MTQAALDVIKAELQNCNKFEAENADDWGVAITFTKDCGSLSQIYNNLPIFHKFCEFECFKTGDFWSAVNKASSCSTIAYFHDLGLYAVVDDNNYEDFIDSIDKFIIDFDVDEAMSSVSIFDRQVFQVIINGCGYKFAFIFTDSSMLKTVQTDTYMIFGADSFGIESKLEINTNCKTIPEFMCECAHYCLMVSYSMTLVERKRRKVLMEKIAKEHANAAK